MLAAVALAAGIMPQPRWMRAESGAFVWPKRVHVAADPRARDAAEQLRAFLAARGVAASLDGGTTARADVRIVLPGAAPFARVGPEGYTLRAGRDGIAVRANTAAGAFYALQTLEQITVRSARELATPSVQVVDWPRFRWRGVHLDTARHFFTVAAIERFVDAAAHYKLNVFHWHLTDDGAWRLASATYPRLVGAGPFYSRADVRAIVAFAARRAVTVVPELDLPAHATAALRAYPSIACGPVVCGGGAGAAFARAVFDEAAAEFPSPFVHAGGDEVPSAYARQAEALVRVAQSRLGARGRRLMVWDDGAHGAVPRSVALTVWTSRARALALARGGYDVVVASAPLYFDAAQGDPRQEAPATRYVSTLRAVYDDAIVPAGATRTERDRVLGAQACLWTEHIGTADALFAMAFPRELALAENLWTPREAKRWDAFLARLPAQLRWLEAHGDAFRIPNASFALAGGPLAFGSVPGDVGSATARTTAREVTVRLSVPLDGAVIRYTAGGAAPNGASSRYAGPFVVRASSTPLVLRAAAFYRGRRGAFTEVRVVRVPALRRERGAASRAWSDIVSP